MFDERELMGTRHIDLVDWCDRLLVCPATANIIGKTASGIADDLLTTLILAAGTKTIFAPAMSSSMYENPVYQENQKRLISMGYRFITPDVGDLACGKIGIGRLPNVDKVISFLKRELLSTDKLRNVRVLVTAGRTEEPLDPVRFLTNRSTGRMGYALAECAANHGATTILISGPSELDPPPVSKFIKVRTAEEMYTKSMEEYKNCHVVIAAAAVADFTPKKLSKGKMKKRGNSISLDFKLTPDILSEMGKRKERRFLVGFSVETENEIENSLKKLMEKNLDLIVVNNPFQEGAAFAGDTNVIKIIDRKRKILSFPKMRKYEAAEKVMEEVIKRIKNNG